MRKETTVIVNGNDNYKIKRKLLITIILLICAIIISAYSINTYITSKKFANEVNEFAKLNSKTVFSIDKIYLYSSANAINNEEKRPIWNVNIYQYTDIALYINNKSTEKLNYENSIKQLYIDNVKFSGLNTGNPSLYYKNINDFAKFKIEKENQITDKLEYKVLNDGDLDYSKPEIYADTSTPITLEYINSNIKENTILSDITTDLKYDGTILRKSAVILGDIKCTMSFNITIINYYNQKFIATAYIEVPLEDSVTGETIYNGKIVKKVENANTIRFFRME